MAMEVEEVGFPCWNPVRRRFDPESPFFAAGNLERELLAKQVALDLTEEEKQQVRNLEDVESSSYVIDISSRELVEKSILPRDEDAISQLADKELYRRACIAEATAAAFRGSLFKRFSSSSLENYKVEVQNLKLELHVRNIEVEKNQLRISKLEQDKENSIEIIRKHNAEKTSLVLNHQNIIQQLNEQIRAKDDELGNLREELISVRGQLEKEKQSGKAKYQSGRTEGVADFRSSPEFVEMLSDLFKPCQDFGRAQGMEDLQDLFPNIDLSTIEGYDPEARSKMLQKCIQYGLERAEDHPELNQPRLQIEGEQVEEAPERQVEQQTTVDVTVSPPQQNPSPLIIQVGPG